MENKSKPVIRAWIAKNYFNQFEVGIERNNQLFLLGVAETSEACKKHLDAYIAQKGYILGTLCEFSTMQEVNRMLEK